MEHVSELVRLFSGQPDLVPRSSSFKKKILAQAATYAQLLLRARVVARVEFPFYFRPISGCAVFNAVGGEVLHVTALCCRFHWDRQIN